MEILEGLFKNLKADFVSVHPTCEVRLSLFYVRMENGFVKIYRQIQDWEWYTDSETVHFFIHCILSANWKDKKWRGNLIKRGQFVTSLSNLSMQTGMSVKKVRIRIDRLVDSGEIEHEGANNFTIITVCKYDTYQPKYEDTGQTKGNQKANKGQTKGNNEEGKEYKEGKENYPQKIIDIVSDIENIDCKHTLLALHIWKDVNDLRPNNKTTLNAKIDTWSEPIRLMVEQDERTHQEIWSLWKKVHKDSFWQKNVLSTAKLRDKFDDLAIKFQSNGKNHARFVDKLFP